MNRSQRASQGCVPPRAILCGVALVIGAALAAINAVAQSSPFSPGYTDAGGCFKGYYEQFTRRSCINSVTNQPSGPDNICGSQEYLRNAWGSADWGYSRGPNSFYRGFGHQYRVDRAMDYSRSVGAQWVSERCNAESGLCEQQFGSRSFFNPVVLPCPAYGYCVGQPPSDDNTASSGLYSPWPVPRLVGIGAEQCTPPSFDDPVLTSNCVHIAAPGFSCPIPVDPSDPSAGVVYGLRTDSHFFNCSTFEPDTWGSMPSCLNPSGVICGQKRVRIVGWMKHTFGSCPCSAGGVCPEGLQCCPGAEGEKPSCQESCDGAPKPPCTASTQCAAGESCQCGSCAPIPPQSCTVDANCPTGFDCVNGECFITEGCAPRSCTTDAQCPNDGCCRRGSCQLGAQCASRCIEGQPCPDGGTCCEGECRTGPCCPAERRCGSSCCAVGQECRAGVCCPVGEVCGFRPPPPPPSPTVTPVPPPPTPEPTITPTPSACDHDDPNYCAGSCCAIDEQCRLGSCCPTRRVCGLGCCALGEECVDNLCEACPESRLCGGTCCDPGQRCVEGSCTDTFNPVCAGVICNGICCPGSPGSCAADGGCPTGESSVEAPSGVFLRR